MVESFLNWLVLLMQRISIPMKETRIDGTLWEARNLLENVKLLLYGNEANTRSKSTLLKYVTVACGLAFAGGLKKAGELGESIEKMAVTRQDSYSIGYGNKAGLVIGIVVAGIVGATFRIGLKKSSSG
ncbi:hypothetical protein Tco_1285179 [Tanacetum coccineum]